MSKYISRKVAERALRKPLPAGAVVHHIDEDQNNNSPTNLVICPNDSYHRLLHVRLSAMKACGNPNYRTCVICGVYDDPSNMQFKKTAHNGAYRHAACISIDNKRQIERRTERTRQWAAARNKAKE